MFDKITEIPIRDQTCLKLELASCHAILGKYADPATTGECPVRVMSSEVGLLSIHCPHTTTKTVCQRERDFLLDNSFECE